MGIYYFDRSENYVTNGKKVTVITDAAFERLMNSNKVEASHMWMYTFANSLKEAKKEMEAKYLK